MKPAKSPCTALMTRRSIIVTDETKPDVPQETPADKPADKPAGESAPKPEEKHQLKSEIRDAIGKVAGIAVEAGSMLGGSAGAGVSAEGEVAEHETEEFVDRIDGEG